jgi:TPR repeat protein
MKPNPQKGLDFLQKAALRGYGQSQVSLGLMYHEGFGIAKSEPDAYAWLSLANKSDGRIGERKDYVPQLLEVMTPEQISEGELKLQRLLLQVKPEKW